MTSPTSTSPSFLPALLSGCLGATASCFAKFAFDPDSVAATWATDWFCNSSSGDIRSQLNGEAVATDYHHYCRVLELIPRGVCILLMISCNAIMLGSFLEGLRESGSVAGVALSSAANFTASAFYGYMLWGERFTTKWWIGFAMVIIGVMILSTVQSTTTKPSSTGTSDQVKKEQ